MLASAPAGSSRPSRRARAGADSTSAARSRDDEPRRLIYAISQADSAGWTSLQTLGIGALALVGLAGFAALERHTARPLLRVERLADRAVGGGFALMLAASAVLFGTFLLSSLYMQDVLGTGPLETGLAFLPLALAAGAGAHVGSQLDQPRRRARADGRRVRGQRGWAAAALAASDPDGSYLTDVLPGMLSQA